MDAGGGISFAYAAQSSTGQLQGDDGQAERDELTGRSRERGQSKRRKRRKRRSLADSDGSDSTGGGTSGPVQATLLTILADTSEMQASDGAGLDLDRLRASAKSLNVALLARLAGNGQRPLDYQVFYPRRIYSPAPAPAPSPSSASLGEPPDSAKTHSKRHSSSGSGSMSASATATGPKSANSQAHYNRTNVVIKAFNYKLRLDLELNDILFGPNLVQKHFIPKGTHISAHQLDNCYYHAKGSTGTDPRSAQAIGAFRTCNGLSGIIHVNNESLVIHPFYNSDLSKKQPHIIYRYQTLGANGRSDIFNSNGATSSDTDQDDAGGTVTIGECANSRYPDEWTMRQFGKVAAPVVRKLINEPGQSDPPWHPAVRHKRSNDKSDSNGNDTSSLASPAVAAVPSSFAQQVHKLTRRDVGLVEKYIELGLVLSKDMFSKRNTSSRLEVLHDAIQVINCLDLYYRRSANTRVGIVYIETWAHGDQIEISSDVKQTLYNFFDYATRHLYGTSKDAVHLMTAGHAQQFDANSFGMSIPDSICTTKAVSVSQESSVLEPFITAATIAHLIGHNLGMEHDEWPQAQQAAASTKGQHQNGRQQPVSSGLTSAEAPTLPVLALASMAPRKQLIPQQSPDPILAGSQKGSVGPIGGGSGVGGNFVAPKGGGGRAKAGSSDEHDEDHDDEIKSRSLTLERGNGYSPASSSLFVQNVQSDMGASEGANDTIGDSLSSSSLAWYDQDLDSDACQLNCIMNERFVYTHPPVAMGNMIQQQVSLTSESTSSKVSGPAAQNNKFALDYQYGQPIVSNESNQLLNFETIQQQQQAGGDQQHPSYDHRHQRLAPAPSLPFKFSKRSIETYYALLREGRAYCLWNMPNKVESSIGPTCGNGIVERDEDCDCGSRSDCWSDTCCERLTCKFRKGVECISGACCDRCKFRPCGHVCRKSRGECDLPEHCDGKSYSCGPDLHKQNGYPCSNQSGYCFMGQCPLHDSQCVDLWGLNASSSERPCYTNLNSNGTIFGNCGHWNSRSKSGGGSSSRSQSTTGSRSHQRQSGQSGADRDGYRRCEPDNVMCGTLQCQLGDMQPVTAELDHAHLPPTAATGSSSAGSGNNANSYQRFASTSSELSASSSSSFSTSYEFSRKILRQSGKDYECKSITRPVFNQQHKHASGSAGKASNSFASSISYVRDGSKCADQHVCFNQTCQPLERVYKDAFELCPRDERGQFCSAHGICSTANRCHCDEGWEGEDCSQAWFQQQQQLPPPPSTVQESGSDHLTSSPDRTATQLNLPQVVSNSNQYFTQQQQQQQQAAYNSSPANYLNETAAIATATPLETTAMSGGASLSKSLVTPPGVEATTGPANTSDSGANVGAVTQPAPVAPIQHQQAQHQHQQTTTSTVQQDKSKHDSLGAHMLVFILVTMVAAVYLGFALMANCYRRKGFIKPDKVLRHHQMNCKMDALRSSFIAKRLALADGSFDPATMPLPSTADVELFNAFMGPVPVPLVNSPRANGYQQFNPPPTSAADDDIALGHFAQQQQQLGNSTGGGDQGGEGSQFVADQTTDRDIQATVHYFDHNQQASAGPRSNQHNFTSSHVKQQQQQQQQQPYQQHHVQSSSNFGYNTNDAADGSGDHIPLLSTGDQAEQHLHRPHHMHKPAPMRSFNARPLVDRRHHYEQQQQQQQQHGRGPSVIHSSQEGASKPSRPVIGAWQTARTNYEQQPEVGRDDQHNLIMNRAFSLGNVSRQYAGQVGTGTANHHHNHHHHNHNYGHNHNHHYGNHQPGRQPISGGPDARHMAHAALATPSRARVSIDANYSQRPKQQLDRDRASSIGYQLNMQLAAAAPVNNRNDENEDQGAELMQTIGLDSCSAPSSPEPRRHGDRMYWPGGSSGSGQQRDDTTCYHEGVLADAVSGAHSGMGRQHSIRLKRSTLRHQHSGDGQQEVDMDDNEQDFDDDQPPLPASPDMSPSPPPPPPPAPPHSLPMLSSSGTRVQATDGDFDADDDDGDDLVGRQHSHGHSQQQQVAAGIRQTSGQQVHKSVMRTFVGQPQSIRAMPACSVSSSIGSRARYTRQPGPNADPMQEHHLSLIGQLQQLEQVQSLHQKQVAAAAAAAAATSGSTATVVTVASDTGGGGVGLHEFFSLPLSVQLSALLARSLAKSSDNQPTAATTSDADPGDADCPLSTSQIDEYLNTLNTSSVAMSSRRSFRGRASGSATTMAVASSTTIASKPLQGGGPSSEQQQQVSGGNSRNATMRKQQAKLQNLQSLISRLQKLHNQTVLQQRFEADLVGGSGDDDYYDGECDDDDDDEGRPVSRNRAKYQSGSSRQSTLGRSSGGRQASSARGIGPGNNGNRPLVTGPRSLADDDIFFDGTQPGATPVHSVNRHQHHQHYGQAEGLSVGGGARSRRAQHMRRSDSHRSRYESTSQASATNKNDLVYSMSDSEDGGGVYVTQMLTRTSKYLRDQQQQQPAAAARVSQVDLKADGGGDDQNAIRQAGANERSDTGASGNQAQVLVESDALRPAEIAALKSRQQQDDHEVGREFKSPPPSGGQTQPGGNNSPLDDTE